MARTMASLLSPRALPHEAAIDLDLVEPEVVNVSDIVA